MKIREKLLFAFVVYVSLAAVLGYFAYSGLKSITERLLLVEVADDITNTILEVRRYEKNYFLFRNKESLEELKHYLAVLKNSIENISKEIILQIGREKFERLGGDVKEYEALIERVVENMAYEEELNRMIASKGLEIEKELKGDELRHFLVVRKHEKNLMLYKDAVNYETLTDRLSAIGPEASREMRLYRTLIGKLYGLYGGEKELVETIRLKARGIQFFTVELAKKERANISSTLGHSMLLLMLALLAVLAIGTYVNIRLSKSIAQPILVLEHATKKIALGDFSEEIAVGGKDEIGSLGGSLNIMKEKLKDALDALEHTIKKLREKQEQLVEAEKLASVGILAAGVAHEISNPLTSVLTFSNLMLEKLPPDDPNRGRLQMMVKETIRARRIIRQLLSFAKETAIRPIKINVNCPVEEIVETLKVQGSFEGIDVGISLDAELPEVKADPSQIGQVILNMLLNSIHSITPPGRIDVSTSEAGGFVEISISDTGCGIPAENLGRVFDPFFTTREMNSGTGLGLAVSYGIIKKHGGDIRVRSKVGEGTTFTVRLPIDG